MQLVLNFPPRKKSWTWRGGGALTLFVVVLFVALLALFWPLLKAAALAQVQADEAAASRWAQWLSIALATFISEDLTTIQTGLLIAQGKLGWLSGTLACYLGILAGDLLLFAAGRWLGRPALTHAPLKWFLSPAAVARSSQWLQERGLVVIALSRFIPGTRLPTYFAAGVLQTDARWFAAYFSLACALWTPLLIGLSVWLGGAAQTELLGAGGWRWLWLAGLGVLLYAVLKFALKLLTWRGRRSLVGWWRRWTRWEFWPPYLFYPPVIAYVLYLAWRQRSLTLFTAANPALPASGFVGESKSAILNGLGAGHPTGHPADHSKIARFVLLAAETSLSERLAQVRAWLMAQGLTWPVVAKPDVGQRGAGVAVIRDEAALQSYLAAHSAATIVQEYVAGEEFGVFYVRLPDAPRGQLFSLTHKTFPVVYGDGQRTVEQLVLDDARAVCLAQLYAERQAARWSQVLPAGRRLQLVELGSHCRGAIFLDGAAYLTPEMTAAFDELSRGYAGFYFGRYDVRAASVAALQAGRDFKVLELNGVTSEATHIYDARHGLWNAYRTLFAQWRLAFAIGAQNRARGASVTSVRELWRMVRAFGAAA